jgi:hypothetical protein
LEPHLTDVNVGVGVQDTSATAIFARLRVGHFYFTPWKLTLPLRPLEVPFAVAGNAVIFVIVVVCAPANISDAITLITSVKFARTLTMFTGFGPLLKVKVAQGEGLPILVGVGKVTKVTIQLLRKFSNVAVALLGQDIVKVLGGDANGAVSVRRIDEVIVYAVERGGNIAPVSAERLKSGEIHGWFAV